MILLYLGPLDLKPYFSEADKSITITYEKPARDKVKAALFKLPPNFYDSPEKPCSGCLGCPELDDVQEICKFSLSFLVRACMRSRLK